MHKGSKLTGFILSSSFGCSSILSHNYGSQYLLESRILTIIFVKDGFTSDSFFLFSSRSFLEAANKKEESFG